MIMVILILLGVCFGSFINAYIWRLHEQGKPPKKRKQINLSIVNGRSVCTHCEHVLAPSDLIPILSWLWLRGKCRYCHKRIDDTPLPELILPALFVLSYVVWPYGFETQGIVMFAAWLLGLIGLVALVLYDARWMLLPNRIVYPLTVLWLVVDLVLVVLSDDPVATALGVALGVLIGGGLFYALFQVSKGKWIGGGDVKLGFMIGFMLMGPAKALLYIFLASLLGTLYALPFMARGNMSKTSKMPFGPFLIVSAILTFLFGTRVIDWYLATFI